MTEKGGNTSNRARLFLAIIQGEGPLGRSIKLKDSGNAEALLEGAPDIRTQAVAAAQSECMGYFQRVRLSAQKISAELTDILKYRTSPGGNFRPEFLGGKVGAYDNRASADEWGTDSNYTA